MCIRVTVIFPKTYLNLKCTSIAQSNKGGFPNHFENLRIFNVPLPTLDIFNVNAVVTNNETNKIRTSGTCDFCMYKS